MGEREKLFELIRYVEQLADELRANHPELLRQKWKDVAWLHKHELTDAYYEFLHRQTPENLRVWSPKCVPIRELPEGSICRISGCSPLEMTYCPTRAFDAGGCLCVPDFCEEFHMGGD